MSRWLRIALQILSFLLFAALLWWAGPEPWRQALSGDWRPLLLALLAHGAAGMVSGARLRQVTQGLMHHPVASWRRFFYVNMAARALGLVLPRTLSAVGGKSAGLRALNVPLQYAIWVVMVDNLFDVLLLGVLVVPALLYLQGTISAALLFTFCITSTVLFGGALAYLLATYRLLPLLRQLVRIPLLARRVKIDQLQKLLPDARTAVITLAWTVLLNLLLVLTYVLIAGALRITTPFALMLATFPIVQLSLIIAIAPGGLGIFDLGWLGLLVFGGLSQADATSFTIAQRAYITVFVLIWTAVSWALALTERLSDHKT